MPPVLGSLTVSTPRIRSSQWSAFSVLNAHYTGTISLLAGIAPMRFFRSSRGHGGLARHHLQHGGARGASVPVRNLARRVRSAHGAAGCLHHGMGRQSSRLRTACPRALASGGSRQDRGRRPDSHAHGCRSGCASAALSGEAMRHLHSHFCTSCTGTGCSTNRSSRGTCVAESAAPVIAACDLARLSAQTGVAGALIEEVAHLYAPGPSLLWLGQGLQRQTAGGNVMRACALLPALTGNLGREGAGISSSSTSP